MPDTITRYGDGATRRAVRPLFEPFRLGDLELPNRVLMAPMTRNRAGDGNVPTAQTAEYYRQRAGAGLIITEASQVSPQGVGYPGTPGIHSAEQVRGWRSVTDAVHAAGGRIFLQLWHVGRVSHPSMQPGGALPVAPSALRPDGEIMTCDGEQAFVEPRALETAEIAGVVDQFRSAAENARTAGFDGVEVHAANGYLLDQFLRDGSNRRDDDYGGSVARRLRFPLEVVRAVLEAWPAQRVGVRLSPCGTMNDMRDSKPRVTFSAMIQALNEFDLAYLHLIEPTSGDVEAGAERIPTKDFRPVYDGRLLVNGGYDGQSAAATIAAGAADLVSFGKPFIANPDLPQRLRLGAGLNEADSDTFYGGDERGYIDYPSLAEERASDAA